MDYNGGARVVSCQVRSVSYIPVAILVSTRERFELDGRPSLKYVSFSKGPLLAITVVTLGAATTRVRLASTMTMGYLPSRPNYN